MLNLIELDKKIKVKTLPELVDLPHIIRVTEFNNESAEKFANEMSSAHATGQDVIPIIIDSYGGEVYSLLSMIDIIKIAKVPVATIVEGKAMSCGAILLSCGTEGFRFAAPNATIMIHEVSSGTFGKVEELKVDAKEAERVNEIINRLMAKNCKIKDKDFFIKKMHEKNHADWYLPPPAAKALNLINHIRVPRFETSVKVESKFV